MRLSPKALTLMTAVEGEGVGLGIEEEMKRELAGPVEFLMSVLL